VVSTSTYLTVAHPGEAEIEVKRSRFLGYVERVADEEQAREVDERIRRERWDAGHHCSAFILGPDAGVQRSSDDGEPSGTAGAPMLEVLRGHEVSDVVAVVTRYFGGTLLGAGGLVRAYSDAVRATLQDAGTLPRRLDDRFAITVGHAEAGRLENDLRAHGVQVLGADFAAEVTLRVSVPAGTNRLTGLLAELTGGSAAAVHLGSGWVDG
jgi:uncharacterized YigZ family protein